MKKLQTVITMLTFLFITINILQAQESTLEQLIPRDKWSYTGINKLRIEEQQALAEEITALISNALKMQRNGVYIIAPSVSTSIKAREIRMQLGIPEVSLRYAAQILVVVRSSLYNPLMYSYDNTFELNKDAEWQLNISGPNFHVYLYSMDDNFRVTQISHTSFPAD